MKTIKCEIELSKALISSILVLMDYENIQDKVFEAMGDCVKVDLDNMGIEKDKVKELKFGIAAMMLSAIEDKIEE